MRRLSALLLALFTLPALAAVRETVIALPEGLGQAVLYTPTAVRAEGPAGKRAKSAPQATAAGVIVVHEWWGLNDYARGRARQLAELGYPAIAVDMYGHGQVADHPDNAQAFMQAALAAPEKMQARFDAAHQALLAGAAVDPARVYAIGYCFGGAVVLNQARRGAELAGVASFHGALGSNSPATPGTVKARVLVATGAADPMVPAEQVGAFVAEMSAAGADLQLLSFPGVVHSFTNPGATAVGKRYGMPLAYDAAADRASWEALLRFIR